MRRGDRELKWPDGQLNRSGLALQKGKPAAYRIRHRGSLHTGIRKTEVQRCRMASQPMRVTGEPALDHGQAGGRRPGACEPVYMSRAGCPVSDPAAVSRTDSAPMSRYRHRARHCVVRHCARSLARHGPYLIWRGDESDQPLSDGRHRTERGPVQTVPRLPPRKLTRPAAGVGISKPAMRDARSPTNASSTFHRSRAPMNALPRMTMCRPALHDKRRSDLHRTRS